ncbi:MAG: LacI family DNA-binding transcriptional regulator [Ignavibacteriae bacterium]|nr:LacI family DNA-binding transcriptional regulator [Ignavibacteriota bacterium]
MGITIYDLAREAGVGIGTVSRCLNNHPSVSAKTREKVLAVAKRLSYQPHAHAQRLASKKSNTFSTIIPFFTNYFFIEVLQGVQDRASELGIDLILYGVNNTAQAEYYLRRSLHGGRVDGVMFFSMKFPESYVAKFEQMKLPLVIVDAYHEKFDSLLVKNLEGAKQATRHLISLGHRNIGMINASLETTPARERLEGYKLALAEAGIPFDMEKVVITSNGKQDGFNREAGYESMKEMLRRGFGRNRATAVFIASDVQAIGALEAAREFGVRVPEDIAVVGFDDIELAKHAQLTTVRQPMYEMGTLALQMLINRMKNPCAAPNHSTFLPELVIRKTCGAQPGVVSSSLHSGIELGEPSS